MIINQVKLRWVENVNANFYTHCQTPKNCNKRTNIPVPTMKSLN